jgi:hypothetical protein
MLIDLSPADAEHLLHRPACNLQLLITSHSTLKTATVWGVIV